MSYAHAYVHLFSYFYTSHTSESLKWQAFSIGTIYFLLIITPPPKKL